MSGRRGFALLATMWLVVAIGVVGLALGIAAKERRLSVANGIEQAEAGAAARGALAIAQSRLEWALTSDSLGAERDPWAEPQLWLADSAVIGRTTVTFTARALGTLASLPALDEEGVRGLLLAAQIDGDRADRVAQEAADWQDADDHPRGRGGERSRYEREGAWVFPRNAPFVTTREFCELRSVTPRDCTRLLPFLTTLGQGGVDLNSAPPEVLGSLPGVSAPVRDIILRRRARGLRWHSLDELTRALPPTLQGELTRWIPDLTRRARFAADEVVVTATGQVAGSPVTVVATGVLTRAGDRALLTWYDLQ